ncbi:MAG TPA: hypothetical protein VF268_00940, partial [Gammaproteobacteria bacterium]
MDFLVIAFLQDSKQLTPGQDHGDFAHRSPVGCDVKDIKMNLTFLSAAARIPFRLRQITRAVRSEWLFSLPAL